MSVIQNPIIGRARNKLGGVIFQTWKGKNVLRSKPLTVANPRTDGQVAQRNKLAEAVAIYRQTPGAVKAGYVQQATGKSEYNAFASEIMKNAMSAAGTVITVAWDDILFSKGTIAKAPDYTGEEGGDSDTANFNWDGGNLQPGQSTTDKFVVVIYNITKDVWTTSFTASTRDLDAAIVALNGTNESTNVIHTWGFFVNTAGNKTSDSQYDTYTIV